MKSAPPASRAVIIGGSISGSLTAAVLSPHFSEVVLLDRDELPTGAELRAGVPHAHQVHALTVGGRLAIEEIYPGWTATAEQEGVPLVDTGRDLKYASKCGWLPRFETDMRSILASRVYIESLIRRCTKRIHNVKYESGVEVKSLILDGDRAVGVRVVSAEGEREVRGDLVVDASGRSSAAPDWLVQIGYDAPEETQINARWGYATTYFTVPDGFDPGFSALFVAPTVTGSGMAATRGGAMWIQEGEIWGLAAQGCAGDFPPGEISAFREFFESFGGNEFTQLIDCGEQVRSLKVWRHAANRYRDFAGLERRPEGIIFVGDSVAAFNPIYGMGMAASAIGAIRLRDFLDQWHRDRSETGYVDGFAEAFQKRLDPIVQDCWRLSTGADLKIPGVRVNGEERPAAQSTPQGEFFDRVLALAVEDQEIALKFIETRQLVRGPEWMGDPALRDRITADWDRLGSMTREAAA